MSSFNLFGVHTNAWIHTLHRILHGCAFRLQTLALEMATKNITVNAICPGYVLTDLVRHYES